MHEYIAGPNFPEPHEIAGTVAVMAAFLTVVARGVLLLAVTFLWRWLFRARRHDGGGTSAPR